jgi:hypothetical protein
MNNTHFFAFRCPPHILMLILGIIPFTVLPVGAQNVTKLFPKNDTPQSTTYFGTTVAMNDRWLLVGEPGNDDFASNSGAVHVYDANKCIWKRKLTTGIAISNGFGESVSLMGDIALIGEPGSSGGSPGTAYLFNVATGKRLATLNPPDGMVSDLFGTNVVLTQHLAIVGASMHDSAASNGGAVYLFEPTSGTFIQKLTAPDAGNLHQFGGGLAAEGYLVAAGSPGTPIGACYLFDGRTGTLIQKLSGPALDGIGSSLAISGRYLLLGASLAGNNGAVHVYDLHSNLIVRTLTATPGQPFESFGSDVALQGRFALISAPESDELETNAGAVYLFDISTGQQMQKFTAPDARSNASFGRTLTLWKDRALIGARQDSEQGMFRGSAYVMQALAAPPPFEKIIATNDSAPGTLGARLITLSDATITAEGETLFTGACQTGATRRVGVWNTLGQNQIIDLALLWGQDLSPAFPNLTAGRFSNLTSNQNTLALFQCTLSGPGTNRFNNQALFRDDGTSVMPLLRLADTPVILGGAALTSFHQILQSNKPSKGLAILSGLRRGLGGVQAGNDSALIWMDQSGDMPFAVQEGTQSPAANTFHGQLLRSAIHQDWLAFTTMLGGSPQTNQGLFRVDPSTLTAPVLVARRGLPAPEANGADFSTLIGETLATSDDLAFKATLRGPGVSSRNNEGLWSERFGSVQLIASKGAPAPVPGSATGVTWRTVLKFWALTGDRVLFTARLQGADVSSRNDLSLWLATSDGNLTLLLREGAAAPGYPDARIATIQRVIAEPTSGHYAVLASLTPTPASSNQALFTGNASLAAAKSVLRYPNLSLLKGLLFREMAGTASHLTSIQVPERDPDRTGAAGRGHGQIINTSGQMVLRLQSLNRTVSLVRYAP